MTVEGYKMRTATQSIKEDLKKQQLQIATNHIGVLLLHIWMNDCGQNVSPNLSFLNPAVSDSRESPPAKPPAW